MRFLGESRAQSIQIGAVLIFGILIILLSLYQAFVVPNQNEEIEFNHNEKVQQEMADLRNAVISRVGSESSSESVSVTLGTNYPSRSIFVNPGPPSGSLRTAGTQNQSVNITIRNASTTGDIGDFWTGDARSYSTGSIVYRPNYNLYQNAPTTIYENSVLYNQFKESNITLSDQSIIQGNTINIAALNGTLQASRSGTTNVDVRSVSSSETRVSVESDGTGPIEIDIPSRLSRQVWNQTLLAGEANANAVDSSDHPVDGLRVITIQLEDDTYTLRMGRVGVGTNVERSLEPAYLTAVEGDGVTLDEGEKQQLVLEVRDEYNNPVSGELVQASVEKGSLDKTTAESDTDGRVEFTYSADGGSGDDKVNVTSNLTWGSPVAGGAFDDDVPRNVTMDITVRPDSGGGAFSINWQDPSTDNPAGALSNCDATQCTWDYAADPDGRLTLRSTTNPKLSGISLDYAVNDTSIAELTRKSGETNDQGTNTTELWNPSSEGWVGSFVATGGGSDVIDIKVENFGLLYQNDATAEDNSGGGTNNSFTENGGVEFSLKNEYGDTVELQSLRINLENDTINAISDKVGNGNDDPMETEVYVTGTGGGTDGQIDYLISDDEYVEVPGDGLSVNFQSPETVNLFGGTTTMPTSSPNPTAASGEFFEFALYEFYAVNAPCSGGCDTSSEFSEVDISGETLSITANFSVGGGPTKTRTFTFTVGGGGGNLAPSASFTASPDPATTGETITLDASGSSDPDGSISSYEWDTNDDGIFGDENGNEVESTSYGSTGTKTITLRVTDDTGATDTTSQTVTVQSSATAYITAIEANPGNNKPPSDSDIEFIQFDLPTSPDTSTWDIAEPGDSTQSFPSDLSGSVYFAGDPTTFANQWDGVSASNVYDLGSITLNNGGDRVVLRNGAGDIQDDFAYNGETTDSGWSFTFSSDGQVANRSYSGGSWDDTDSAGDFSEEGECAFFGGGDGCAASSVNVVSTATTGGAGSELSFDLQNTGPNPATIEQISLDSTTSTATEVEAPGNNAEFLQNGNDRLDQVMQIDGTSYTLDTFATISSGDTDTFALERALDTNGDKVDMTGEDLTITLQYSDGTTGQYTLSF